MTERPVGGDRGPIDSEVERLRSLRDQLNRAAQRLRDVHVTEWSGAAADAFDGVLATLCAELYRAADQHDDAASRLAEYRDVRQRASALAKDISAEWAGTQIPVHVGERLTALYWQVRYAGSQAAEGMRRAAAMLYDTRRRLHELPSGPGFPIPTAAPATRPERPNGHSTEQPPPTTTPTTPPPPAPASITLAAPNVPAAPITPITPVVAATPAVPNVNFESTMKVALAAELRRATRFVPVVPG